jgi:type II secretory pathway component PulC
MPKMTVDQIKKYIVIGLSLVLAIVGYFRLIHGKTQPEEIKNPSLSDSNAPEFDTQIVEPVTWQQEDWHARLAAEPMRLLRRDIFIPAKPLKSVKRKPVANVQEKPIPKLKLRGTVVGGDEPIAIIDDQFIRTNESIAGYKVIWIGPKMVVLGSGEKKLILELMQND